MTNQKHKERRALGLEVMESLMGTATPEVNAQALEDANGPLGSFAVDYIFGDLWSRPGLNRRDRSLIVIAALVSLNQLNQLRVHVRGGINHGLSATEIREIIIHLCVYAGFPRALDAMKVANEELVKMGQAPADKKLEPAKPIDQEERRALGTDGLSRVSGGAFPADPDKGLAAVQSRLGDLGTVAVEFAFAEVWSREELSRRDRSLVVVSALTTLGRKDELDVHVPGAIHHGVTRAEVEELMVMLSAYAGFPFAVEGMRVIHDKLE
ncbi:MAG: carboxymuconolactone decarboxylase family protein [Porticoccaceae bacterium]|nr:carboxymuconolactone decarboxylase family protein [Porticoccaceae bacterium]